MSDAFGYLMESGLWEEIVHTRGWARQHMISDDFELFLNPDDVKSLATGVEDLSGYTVIGMPLRQSIGVERGKCMIFDRTRGKYIRRGEPVQG